VRLWDSSFASALMGLRRACCERRIHAFKELQEHEADRVSSGSPTPSAYQVAAFNQGLNETGYVEGQNVAIEYRWADGHYDRLPALAADLVNRQVAVIATGGGDPAALAAKAATATIPIVLYTGSDPVTLGLVASLNRPGGNVTGVSILSSMLLAKQLELLRELVPTALTISFLVNPNNPNTEERTREMQEAVRAVGQRLHVIIANVEAELEPAFATIQGRASALIVPADPFFTGQRDRLVALGSALCGVFFAPRIPHHVRGHLKKLHLKMRGVFCHLQIPTTSADGIRKKTPSGNGWCFFAPADSHHVRAQASGKIASRKSRKCS
jgi:hypothetical protein